MTVAGASPAPWWVVAAVAALGLVVGHLLSARLATGGYRLDDEADRPLPGPAPLVTVAVPLLWAALAWRLGGLAAGAVLPAYLLLATVGVALFWIDVDVHRLPEGLTLPTIPALVGLLALASASTGDWAALGRAVACGVAGWLLYVLIALAWPGGLGLGDATLGGLVALPLGYLAWWVPVVGVLLAYLVAGVVAVVGLALRRLHLKSDIAFGPFILLGALAAVFLRIQMLGA